MKSRDKEESPANCATGRTRLFVDEELCQGAAIELREEQAHYLLNVLRLGEGAIVLLFNNRDGEWTASITEVRKKRCTLAVAAQTRGFEPLPDIWLLFAPVKRARLDFIAQKATEMGAGVIQPVITHRTIVARVKDERLQANIIEAAEQCGLVALPELREAISLSHLLDHWSERAPERRILYCDEAAEAGEAEAILTRLAEEGGRGKRWAVLIGPEGGFAADERARLHARRDTVAISLGPRIMRADTAAIAALAIVQLKLGDW
jgi:16S rRNA (uracil1498-N3)-methyltransferase